MGFSVHNGSGGIENWGGGWSFWLRMTERGYRRWDDRIDDETRRCEGGLSKNREKEERGPICAPKTRGTRAYMHDVRRSAVASSGSTDNYLCQDISSVLWL